MHELEPTFLDDEESHPHVMQNGVRGLDLSSLQRAIDRERQERDASAGFVTRGFRHGGSFHPDAMIVSYNPTDSPDDFEIVS